MMSFFFEITGEKKGTPQTNSASGGRGKVPSRRRLARSSGKKIPDPREGRGFPSCPAASPSRGDFVHVPVLGYHFVRKEFFRGWDIIIPSGVFSSFPRVFFSVRTYSSTYNTALLGACCNSSRLRAYGGLRFLYESTKLRKCDFFFS